MSGLRPTSTFLPYGRQAVDDDDIAAVAEALRSDYLTTGPRVDAFEQALKEYCGAKHAIAVANGTAALHIAMLAAGLKAGDRALTSTNTFLASANCAEFTGATADFSDIDPQTYNVTANTLQAAWKDDVRAVVPVDFAGLPCDMPAIAAHARSRNAIIIEDACHAIGSQFQHEGRWYKTGNHPWADMTIFSFHPVKTITTGEGGAILTNNDALADRCRLFRNHGMVREPGRFQGLGAAPDSALSETGPWYYEMQELGFNYRITDFQCALGLTQLKKLDAFIQRRAEIVSLYNEAFRDFPGIVCPLSTGSPFPCRPAWHLYAVQIDFAKLGRTRTSVMAALRERGIGTQVHYIPVHLQPYYRQRHGYGPGKCPVAESSYPRMLSLPIFPRMSAADVAYVAAAVRECVGTGRPAISR